METMLGAAAVLFLGSTQNWKQPVRLLRAVLFTKVKGSKQPNGQQTNGQTKCVVSTQAYHSLRETSKHYARQKKADHKWSSYLWSHLHKLCPEQVNLWTKQISGCLDWKDQEGGKTTDRDGNKIVLDTDSGDGHTALHILGTTSAQFKNG